MSARNTSLGSALAALNAELSDSSIDLGRSFDLFIEAVRSAVPSYCGMSITLVAAGMPVTITAPDARVDDGDGGATPVASSLVIPLSTITATAVGELVILGSTAGAFVDLAADLAYETATELVAFAVDTRLGQTVASAVGVAGFSVIHQAIGVLVESGLTPEEAQDRIKQIAAADGHDLIAAAESIVAGINP